MSPAPHDDAAIGELMRRGLDWLASVAPYDLATIFALEGEELVVQTARGALANPELAGHRIALSAFPTVAEAIETRRARAFTEADHRHGDGDPFDGVLDLPPGHSCMVVPLTAGDRTLGVLSLDRTKCEIYPESTVQLVELYGRLLALAIHHARQRAALVGLSERQRMHAATLERRLSGADAGVFEDSRAPAVRRLATRAAQVARTDTPVLLRGETGTGKERLAHTIHAWSARADGPFVAVNCAALPDALLESELFGHEKGAFTGATAARVGRFRVADGGTLFLDEIGELGPALQAKLLRVVQEGEVQPLGSDQKRRVDVRLLAATHVDLEAAIAEGRFREDLYYRLSVFPLHIPPLRERLEDLPQLAHNLLRARGERLGRRHLTLGANALDALRAHDWPGNIRELANVLERAAIVSDGHIEPHHVSLGPRDTPTSSPAPRSPADPDAPLLSMSEMERLHIERALRHTRGKIYGADGAAALLGLKPTTLQSRIKKHGIDRHALPAR